MMTQVARLPLTPATPALSRTTVALRPLTPPTSSPSLPLLASSASAPPLHGQTSRSQVFQALLKMSHTLPSPPQPVVLPLQPSSKSHEAATFQSVLPPLHSPTSRLRDGRYRHNQCSCFQPPPPRQLPLPFSLIKTARWASGRPRHTHSFLSWVMDCSVVRFHLVVWQETLPVSKPGQTA